ncbi:MAG TPA: filamentous hemagglutinin N-terminal domain-containing protein [Candidatus Acidoferrum sp.]|nr:filamentous hemagglutinin N-terminal domain-containing protein [Candidatus Acidoferrum sp.]
MKSNLKKPTLWLAAVLIFNDRISNALANPSGLTVSSGSASTQQIGSQLNVTASQLAILNWQSFNIGNGETTTFQQPSSSSIVFNEIGSANPSQILGHLNANGTVILANANGFYFGPNSMVNVGGSFIATTAPLPPDLGAGASWQFTGMPPTASIVNYGKLQVGNGQSLYLIAEKVDNEGSLTAPGGEVGLLAGQSVLVSESADGRGLSATVKVPAGTVNNAGQISADAGTIALQAQVVNQDGLLQADSIRNQNGVIELVASDAVNLGANSQITAEGNDSAAGSSGGTVLIQSGNQFTDDAGSRISVAGGTQGGNGGNLEISAPCITSLNSSMDAGAQSGWAGGTFLLDPVNIILGTSTANGAIDVNTAFSQFGTILLQASGNITLNASTTWNLSSSTGETTGQLTMQAGGDIIFGNKSKILDANDWSVSLYTGYDFANNTVKSGTGNIYLNGGSGLTQSGTIQTANGDINLFAGESILVAPVGSQVVSGSIFTTAGGSIFAYAAAGDIVAGTSNGSANGTTQTSDYNFTSAGAKPNPYLGGISTAAGGNVTLIAGDDIDSTPIVPSRQAPGASGAYGSGNVTVIAGNQITGNYTLANGVGTMLAGVGATSGQAAILQNPGADPSAYAPTLIDLETAVMQSQNANGNIGSAPVAGTPSIAPVRLSLISGSWNTWAANDISLKEVNNPNGAFNVSQSFLFNYGTDAAANLWAGNAIELVDANLQRLTTVNRTPIYAPILSLNAGAGGIKIDNSIILAPSSEGALSIVTRNGGNLVGAAASGSTVLNGITMSDGNVSDYTTYAAGHDDVHSKDLNPQPVNLDISGSIGSFSLTVPTFADVTVRGTQPFVTPTGTSVYGTYNFGFQGRNVAAGAITSINVTGTISYRGDLTSESLSDVLPAWVFNPSLSGDPEVASKLSYDAATGTLTFIGVMTAAEESFLLNPTQIVLDQNGNPVLDVNNNPVTTPVTLDATQRTVIQQLYTASQSASLGGQGLALGGSGIFNVTAYAIDLGVSGGINVVAPDSALASISPYGAVLNVTTLGDLDMTSSKIANQSYLGSINLNVGGVLNVGGALSAFGDPGSSPLGIFTTSGGSVNVSAGGDVNVEGSRIAAYDGGDISVKSLDGDVNAGTGGESYVSMNSLQLDSSGQLTSIAAKIPGSGILATTVVGSDASLGSININAPNGNVNASLGGIIQIAFNGNTPLGAQVQVNAGQNINAGGSGIIGSAIKLKAGGSINGLVIGSQSVNINSAQNVNVTAFSGGDVSINAGGTVSGTVVGGSSVDVSGSSITASLISGSIATSGDTTGANIGIPQSNVQPAVAQTADNATAATSKLDDNSGDGSEDDKKKKGNGISLAQRVSRVTVLLPHKD